MPHFTPEDFLPVPDFPDYEINCCGTVRRATPYARGSTARMGAILAPYLRANGYTQIILHRNSTRKRFLVHVLVATVFVGERPGPEFQVSHEDNCRSNNYYGNLTWRTPKDNMAIQEKFGTICRGSANGRSILTESTVAEIRRRAASGELQKLLAIEYGVHKTLISLVVCGKVWRHVP